MRLVRPARCEGLILVRPAYSGVRLPYTLKPPITSPCVGAQPTVPQGQPQSGGSLAAVPGGLCADAV